MSGERPSAYNLPEVAAAAAWSKACFLYPVGPEGDVGPMLRAAFGGLPFRPVRGGLAGEELLRWFRDRTSAGLCASVPERAPQDRPPADSGPPGQRAMFSTPLRGAGLDAQETREAEEAASLAGLTSALMRGREDPRAPEVGRDARAPHLFRWGVARRPLLVGHRARAEEKASTDRAQGASLAKMEREPMRWPETQCHAPLIDRVEFRNAALPHRLQYDIRQDDGMYRILTATEWQRCGSPWWTIPRSAVGVPRHTCAGGSGFYGPGSRELALLRRCNLHRLRAESQPDRQTRVVQLNWVPTLEETPCQQVAHGSFLMEAHSRKHGPVVVQLLAASRVQPMVRAPLAERLRLGTLPIFSGDFRQDFVDRCCRPAGVYRASQWPCARGVSDGIEAERL